MMTMMFLPTQLSSHRPAHRPEVRYLWKRRGLSPPRVGFDPNTTPNQTLYPQRPQKRPPTPHTCSKLKKRGRRTIGNKRKVLKALLRMFGAQTKGAQDRERALFARPQRAVARCLGFWWRADLVFFANGETFRKRGGGQ